LITRREPGTREAGGSGSWSWGGEAALERAPDELRRRGPDRIKTTPSLK